MKRKHSIAGIINRDGRFLIGRRLPTGEMGSRWEFPGGKVDRGETPETAIVREFREELGIDVIPCERIASAEFTNKGGPVTLLAYRIEIPEKAKYTLTEHTEISWATMDEIQKLDFVDSDRLLIPGIKRWYGV